MTQIELDFFGKVPRQLQRIAETLERIADSLENKNE